MATIPILVLALVCLAAAIPYPRSENNVTRNTIFAEERFEGEPFYDGEIDVELSNDIVPASYRLPTTTKPIHYKIYIWTDFESTDSISERMFGGDVEIRLTATEVNVNEIVLHANELDIISLTLTRGTENIPVTYAFDNPANHHFLKVKLTTGTLEYNAEQPVEYVLHIKYDAAMRTDMYGIYESWYWVGDQLKWMATTQFQATAARSAFPCYDEPSFKATFDFTIRRPSNYESWSCTRISQTVPFGSDGKFEEDIYTRTPLMSTYLIAIIVADYGTTRKEPKETYEYEVIARHEAINAGQAKYADDVGRRLLDRMNKHTNMNFYTMDPNLKMTQAAIPDFGAGAMENWGLLTYREAYLMYDPLHSDSVFKQRIGYILSHEIAHMWFGNLVTCNWWDVLWLNEGFARYYQYYLTDWVETDMGFDKRFVVEQVHNSLLTDSGNNPHPLTTTDIGSPASVSAMFSTISYNKGACIIRMTEHLLGFEVHERGLQKYLQDNKFKNALPENLFQALQEEAVRSEAIAEYGPDFSVTEYYKLFTEQPGVPMITVDVNHETGQMTITQQRFSINTGISNLDTQWVIPVTFSSASKRNFENTKPTHIVRGSRIIIDRGSIGDEWVIFNHQQTGYYRVNYDEYTWDLITLALRGDDRNVIHEHNRAQIVNDVFQYARADLMTYTRAFNILSFLEFETAYAPWVAAMTGFNWIRSRVTGQEIQQELEALIVKWSEKVMAEIGYDETGTEPFMRSYLRYQLAPIMCQLDAPGCRTTAIRLFNNLKATPSVEVPVDSRIWVYCTALREGTEADFSFLWERFLGHNVYTEKILLLQVLGCTPHAASLKIFLDAIVDDTHVIRKQDYTTAFNSAVTGNEGNRLIVFDYIKNYMDKVKAAFGSYTTPLSYISSRLRTRDEVSEFRDWANEQHLVLGANFVSVYNGALSSWDSIVWAETNANDFKSFFANGYQGIKPYRLPTTTSPVKYQVSLTPHFEPNFNFDGEVFITIKTNEGGVREIVMHCNDLKIHSLVVTDTTTKEEVALRNSDMPECDRQSFLKIYTEPLLVVDREYEIKMTFTGNLQTNMRGFYRSWYIDSTGTKRWMATTQFQPGHARQAFPCYDEPSFKAQFDITINREADFSDTISNMPRKSRNTLPNGRIAETFYTTPKTSTYLLAFIVSHYKIIAASTDDPDRPFDIYARDNAGNTGDWSLEVGKELLAKMEEYTGIDYYKMQTYMNMKQAAIPDFSAGAMENWGLLTYREALILYDEKNSNHNYKQRVANIVSHEITHMWFGNLVTCAWWDNLWLNEGFARFYQYFLTDLVRPELGYGTRFIVEQLHTAMFADSIDSAHPLTDPSVANPASVSAHFSTITYARGAAILRMTQYLLGKPTYEKALRNYLKNRSYDVAEPHHLFSELDKAAAEDNALGSYDGITIEEYFPSWSVQAGHPLLTVTVDSQTGAISISQARWERNDGVSTQDSLYYVPITWTRGGNMDFEDLKPIQIMKERTTTIQRGTQGFEWVILNKQQAGFYRINYDSDNWVLITRALRSNVRTSIHELNRAQIVDDLFALARAGVKSYADVFNIFSFLEFDDSYAPWIAAISGFNFLRRRLAHDQDELQKLDEMIIELSSAVTARLEYDERPETDTFMDGLLRMYVMTFLCNVGHPTCVRAGVNNFRNFVNEGTFIPANMRPWVYCAGLREGGATDFDKLWERYIEDDLASEKIVILEALGCTKDRDSLRTYLDSIVANADYIRAQDYNTALNSATSGNEENTQIVFEWLKENLDKATNTLGSVSTLLGYISGRLLTQRQITEYIQWVEENEASLGPSTFNSAMSGANSARQNLLWSDTRLPEMVVYFEEGYKDILLEGEDSEKEPEPEPEPVPTTDTTPTTDSADITKMGLITILVALCLSVLL